MKPPKITHGRPFGMPISIPQSWLEQEKDPTVIKSTIKQWLQLHEKLPNQPNSYFVDIRPKTLFTYIMGHNADTKRDQALLKFLSDPTEANGPRNRIENYIKLTKQYWQLNQDFNGPQLILPSENEEQYMILQNIPIPDENTGTTREFIEHYNHVATLDNLCETIGLDLAMYFVYDIKEQPAATDEDDTKLKDFISLLQDSKRISRPTIIHMLIQANYNAPEIVSLLEN